MNIILANRMMEIALICLFLTKNRIEEVPGHTVQFNRGYGFDHPGDPLP